MVLKFACKVFVDSANYRTISFMIKFFSLSTLGTFWLCFVKAARCNLKLSPFVWCQLLLHGIKPTLWLGGFWKPPSFLTKKKEWSRGLDGVNNNTGFLPPFLWGGLVICKVSISTLGSFTVTILVYWNPYGPGFDHKNQS